MDNHAAGPWRTDEPPEDDEYLVALTGGRFETDVWDGEMWLIWDDEALAWAPIYPYKEGEHANDKSDR